MLNYVIEGSGNRTLVFIHGFGGSQGLWHWQVEEFAPLVRCLAVDLPGHGASPWRSSTLSGMAEEVLMVLRRESVIPVHVVASSFGGLVALKIAERAPECLSAISFTGSLPCFTENADFSAGLDVQRIRKLAGQFGGDVASVLEMFFRSLFTRKERESAQYSRIKMLRKELPLPQREALLAILNMLEHEDLRLLFKTVNFPVQFIQGDQDMICPLAATEKVLAIKPSARVDIIKNCGHFPFLSYPAEFGRHLKEFTGL